MRNMTGTQRYPTAVAEIKLDGHHHKKKVATLEQLEADALLGMDVSLWSHLIEVIKPDELVQLRKLAEAKESSYPVSILARVNKTET